jgi:acetone carboxylase gamma subunit
MKRLSSNLYVEPVNGHEMVHCVCGFILGPADADKDPKKLLKAKHADLSKAGPNVNPHGLGVGRFFLREYYCPSCFRLIETEVALKEP